MCSCCIIKKFETIGIVISIKKQIFVTVDWACMTKDVDSEN